MPTTNWTRIAIALAAAIASGVVWLTTGDVDFNYAKWTVGASTVVIIGLLLFDSVLWRYLPFRWLVRRPVLHGTWKMEQGTSYEPRRNETMESYLVVHQTYSGIRVDGLYPISDSECLTANLSVDKHRCTLSFLFRSEAHTMNREGNPPLAAPRFSRSPVGRVSTLRATTGWSAARTGGSRPLATRRSSTRPLPPPKARATEPLTARRRARRSCRTHRSYPAGAEVSSADHGSPLGLAQWRSSASL